MRGFTILAAVVVGLTWALTIVVCDADPEPNRIINPFRKNLQPPSGTDNEENESPRQRFSFGRFEGNPINARRFSRKLDNELLQISKGSRKSPATTESRENQIVYALN